MSLILPSPVDTCLSLSTYPLSVIFDTAEPLLLLETLSSLGFESLHCLKSLPTFLADHSQSPMLTPSPVRPLNTGFPHGFIPDPPGYLHPPSRLHASTTAYSDESKGGGLSLISLKL